MPQDISQNNKRIAKNTLLLYLRMFVVMFVSLFTSRIVLDSLGEVDYGIYNVVGGVVTMFSILTGSLSTAIGRFITVELGKGDMKMLKKVFATSVTVQIIMALIMFVIIEIIGVWFLNSKMNIPADRLYAANWVLQLSIINFAVGIISIPYSSAIISHEHMKTFAYISILDVVFRLLIVYALYVTGFDRLITYAVLLWLFQLVIFAVYAIYCRLKFEECRFTLSFDKHLFKDMASFAGWNFIGSASAIMRDQGVNVAINLFCGPAVNAARGIAMQVSNAITQFVNNFMTAVNPQIMKSYARGDKDYLMTLLFQSARFSFFLLLFLSLPVIIETPFILNIWLKSVPEHTINFIRLVLIFVLSDSISYPLITAMLATGKIRNYQLVVGSLQILNLPISYIALRQGLPVETTLVIAIVISQICFLARLIMLRPLIGISIRLFIQKVYLNVVSVAVFALLFPLLLRHFLHDNNFLNFIIVIFVTLLSSALFIFYVGCNEQERNFASSKVKQIKLNLGSKL